MIRSALFVLAAASLALPSAAQADVFGVVADAETEGPVVAATVGVVDGAGRVRGRATGSEGEFVYRGLPAGRYLLRVSAVGYQTRADTLVLEAGDRIDLVVELTPSTSALGRVDVEADAAPIIREAGLTRIRAADVRALPTTDPGGDLVAGILASAGVSTAGDRGGQISVRGGTPTQNLVLVDGIPVFQPFHLFGAYSALPAGVVRSADVYSGGWPARFGGRIASVVDVVGRTAHKTKPAGAATVSPFVAGLEAEIPVVPGDLSVLASARRSLVEDAAQAVGAELPYRFEDAFAKAHARLDATSTLQATALYAFDEGDLGRTGDVLRQTTTAAGGQFFSISSEFAAALDISAYWSEYVSEFVPSAGLASGPPRRSESTVFGGRFGYVYYVGPHTVRTGIQASSYRFVYSFRPEAEQTDNVSEGSVFVDAELDFGALRIEPGLRAQTFPAQTQPSSLEPRLLVSYARGESVWRAAGGVYRQEIVGLTDQRDIGDVFTAWTTTSNALPIPTATHGLVGWEGLVAPGLRLGVEGYAKALSGQTILVGGRLLSTNGEAYGADVTASYRRPGVRLEVVYGAASLTYRDVEREYRPPFHRPHRFSVSGRAERGPWAASVAFQLTSGRPVQRVLGTFRDLEGGDVLTASGRPTAVFEAEPYAGRTPPYHRLDVSLEWAARLARADVVVQAAVVNATNRANVFYYDALRDARVDQLPLLPTLGLRLEVD